MLAVAHNTSKTSKLPTKSNCYAKECEDGQMSPSLELEAVREYLDGDIRGWEIRPAEIVHVRSEYGGSLIVAKPNTHWLNAEIIIHLFGSNIEVATQGTSQPATIFDLAHPNSLDDIKDYVQTLIAYTFDD
jgi:hypothetical protein